MSLIDTPIGKRKITGGLSDEIRDDARKIIEDNIDNNLNN